MGFVEYKLKSFKDDKGGLTPIEFVNFCDFSPKRIYTVYESEGKTRGGHAHLVEEELFFMSNGSCTGRFHDGIQWFEVRLTANENLVYVPVMLWHEFCDFSAGAVLVAVSSTIYNSDRSDYIEDFDNFLSNV